MDETFKGKTEKWVTTNLFANFASTPIFLFFYEILPCEKKIKWYQDIIMEGKN